MFIRPDAEIRHEYAEAELLDLVRGDVEAEDFTLTITRHGGNWIVSAGVVGEAVTRSTSTGASFAEAWLKQNSAALAVIEGGR